MAKDLWATETETITLNASAAATAWLNAFLATGQDEDRRVLFRTLSVEIFREGVQFIACDGLLLFRTWVPKHQTDADWPREFERPVRSIVVMDPGHFALGFVRTLLAATKDRDYLELALTVEPAPEPEGETPLGAEFSAEVLTLRALGQQLHCRLYEDTYADWRKLQFGIEEGERVDGMKIATRMFAAVGKLKSIHGIECTFTGDERHIVLVGDGSFRGILMPMRRAQKETPEAPPVDPAQTDALEDQGVPPSTVKVNGRWVPATEANVARAAEALVHGRDRAAGRD